MNKLLLLEWYKLRNWNLFKVMIGIYMVFLPLFFLSGRGTEPVKTMGGDSLYSFPKIWAGLGYGGSWLTFFCFGFMAIVMLSNEIGNKTFRQNVIAGLTRTQLLASKIYAMLVISLFATLYYALVGLLIGLVFTEPSSYNQMGEMAYFIPRYFLQCFGWMTFALFLGMLFRKTTFAVFFYFVYTFVIELCLRWFVHRNIIEGKSMHFYPMNTFEDLVWPFAEVFTENGTPFQIQFDLTLGAWEAIIGSIIYIGIFLGLSFYLTKKRDL